MKEVEDSIVELERCINYWNDRPILLGGDFNAKATMWRSPNTNARGIFVSNWASSIGLSCLNTDNRSTCVRRNGESIVDLTFANQKASARIIEWRVSLLESASDHRYIEIEMGKTSSQRLKERLPKPKRWSIKKLDEDIFRASLLAGSWINNFFQNNNPEENALHLQDIVTHACDTAMPRVIPRTYKAMPWWSEELELLRRESTKARRRIKRNRRFENLEEQQDRILVVEAYKQTIKNLSKALRKAKARAWDDFVGTLNENPWGRPYKTVMGKLRRWTPPFTEYLEDPILKRVLEGLFPPPLTNVGEWKEVTLPRVGYRIWDDKFEVTIAEMKAAVKRMMGKNSAPGPNGIPSRIWAIAIPEMAQNFGNLYSRCMREGIFPSIWKKASLVLLRKPGKPEDQSNGYRPICLLNDEAKIFERIIAERINEHLNGRGPNLDPSQYGFRKGRSTVDAILAVRQFMESAFDHGQVIIAVSLDISNAFNSIPWEVIGNSLTEHRIPLYLRKVIRSYLKERSLVFPNRNGGLSLRTVERGVPQGSILGPLLWNLGFNSIMKREDLPEESGVICYADDTLILASGRDWQEASMFAAEATNIVVQRIEERGLSVALKKTEAACFYRKGKPTKTNIKVAGVEIQIRSSIKYLGLLLDSKWCFLPHFTELAPKMERASMALCRLLPNIGGPNNRVRRLFANVVASIALYGAPVWAYDILKNRKILSIMRASQRRMAGRAIRAYKTVSFDMVTALAGMPPFELMAQKYLEVYERVAELKETVETMIHPRMLNGIQEIAQCNLIDEWQIWLRRAEQGRGTVLGVIASQLQQWINARIGLPFRSTQIISGHGCFGKFLHRIGRETSSACWHCDSVCDSASHTLRDCPAWAIERANLLREVGDLSWETLIRALYRDKGRSAFVTFAEKVMRRKENTERLREGMPM